MKLRRAGTCSLCQFLNTSITQITLVVHTYLPKYTIYSFRYHLSAAGTVLDNLEVSMSQHPELGKAQADLARCWIHYGLHLFGTSKKYIMERMCKEDVLDLGTLRVEYTNPLIVVSITVLQCQKRNSSLSPKKS